MKRNVINIAIEALRPILGRRICGRLSRNDHPDFAGEPSNFHKTKTSQDLSIDELRLLGMALDLAESPVTVYGKDKLPIYANAAARSFWPITFDCVDKGHSMEEATRNQIRALSPEITEETLDAHVRAVFEGFERREPMILHASGNRICRTAHHPINNVAIAGMGVEITELRKKSEQLKAARESAEFRAVHDALTSLPNRDQFRKIIKMQIESQPDHPFWLLMCDIDKFKLVNDVHGHDVGDQVLTDFGHFVTRVIDGDVIVSRLGGDEFAILIRDQPDQRLDASKLKTMLNEDLFEIKVGDRDLEVEFSAGAARYPTDAESYKDLLKCADLALLRSKSDNTSRIDFYDAQLGIEYTNGLNLFTEVQTAISKQEIVPYFQPVVDIKTRKIVRLEALARWIHPIRGLLTPCDFEAIFDDKYLSLELSKHMLKMVNQFLIHLHEKGIPVCPVNINVEASDLLDQSFLADLLAYSTSDPIIPEYLGIEITENSILNVDNQSLLDSMAAIKKLGIEVMLDDFGTGFSSITHLDHLPIAGLKLDKSYIQKIQGNERSWTIVAAIVRLAQDLGLSTVAEGVEDIETLQAIERAGCTACQGHYFSQALSADQIENLLVENFPNISKMRSAG